MEGHLRMSLKERERKSIFDQVRKGVLKLTDAACTLGLSYRQCKRSYKRYREEGDRGLIHRSRGRASNRSKPAGLKEAVVSYCQEHLEGFGPTLASEKLGERGWRVARETLRRWLISAGLWTRCRKRHQHRSRRERRGHFGELVQMDGSPHHWFGEERPEACLMNMVDDAQGTTLSLMASAETTEVAMRVLWAWIERYGIPRELYTDRKNVFVTERAPTLEEQLAGELPLTAFGKACKRLGIHIITAHSPQAKGRVERSHGVYQDRFVKELRLRDITTVEGANHMLQEGFCDMLNAKFAQPPRERADYHRRLPKGMNLAEIFVREETRRVSNDWTFSYRNRAYQIHANNRPLPKPKDEIIVRTRLDGTVAMIYRNKALSYSEIERPTCKAGKRRARVRQAPKSRPLAKPSRKHPWRQNCTLMAAEAPGSAAP
jgi:hypothetical protein